jgi:single-strand DNA-binding protein
MTDTITVTGVVATPPNHIVTSAGLPITSFRLASTQRRYDRAQQKWVDGDTNWYTVTCFRQLATNVVGSVAKGQRVVVTGRLRVRDWKTDEKAGTNIEVDADALGHDLAWGTAVFTRSVSSSVAHDADRPSDRPTALDDGIEGEPSDPLVDGADTARAPEAALPF